MTIKEKLQKLQLNRDRSKAIREAWAREKEFVLQGRGTVDWTSAQQMELIARGRVTGYEGQHMYSCARYPQYAALVDNIQIISHEDHVKAHNSVTGGGGFRTPTSGYYDVNTGIMHDFGGAIPLSPIPQRLTNAVVVNSCEKNMTKKNSNGGACMQGTIDERKYEAMISALNTFATKVSQYIADMGAQVNVCAQAIGAEDNAIIQVTDKVKDCQDKYEIAIQTARDIASKMWDQLEEQRKERELWASED